MSRKKIEDEERSYWAYGEGQWSEAGQEKREAEMRGQRRAFELW